MRKIHKAALVDKVTIEVELTREQYDAVKALGDEYRLTVPEIAKAGIFEVMNLDAGCDPHVEMISVLRDANEDRETGKHPGFEAWKEEVLKMDDTEAA